MDQHSFEQGVLLGLDTALVIVSANPRGPMREITHYRDEMRDHIAIRRGKKARAMVEADVFLQMPMMVADDIGWPAPSPTDRSEGGGE